MNPGPIAISFTFLFYNYCLCVRCVCVGVCRMSAHTSWYMCADHNFWEIVLSPSTAGSGDQTQTISLAKQGLLSQSYLTGELPQWGAASVGSCLTGGPPHWGAVSLGAASLGSRLTGEPPHWLHKHPRGRIDSQSSEFTSEITGAYLGDSCRVSSHLWNSLFKCPEV